MPEVELLKALIKAVGSLARSFPDAEVEPLGRCRGDGGYTIEMVIAIAGMAALALAVLVIIVNKVTNAANNIPTQ